MGITGAEHDPTTEGEKLVSGGRHIFHFHDRERFFSMNWFHQPCYFDFQALVGVLEDGERSEDTGGR